MALNLGKLLKRPPMATIPPPQAADGLVPPDQAAPPNMGQLMGPPQRAAKKKVKKGKKY